MKTSFIASFAIVLIITTIIKANLDHCFYRGDILSVGERLPLAEKCSWLVCNYALVNNSQLPNLKIEVTYPSCGCCIEDGTMYQDGTNITRASGLKISCCEGKWIHVIPVTLAPTRAPTPFPTHTLAPAPALSIEDSSVVLVIGGDGTKGNVETMFSVEVFDPLGLCHVNLPDTHGLERHSAHYLNKTGEVLMCGSRRKCRVLIDDQFHHHSNMVEERSDHSAVLFSDKLWIIGGWRAPTSMETLSIPGNVWSKEATQIEEGRYSSCAVGTSNNNILLIAGISGYHNDGHSQYIERTQVADFNTITKEWTTLAPMLGKARQSHSCIHIPATNGGNGQVLVAGGYDGTILRTAQIYNIDTNEWKIAGSLNKKRYDGEMLVVNQRILFIGGRESRSCLASVEEFHPGNDTWTILDQTLKKPQDSPGRAEFAATVVPRSVVGC